MTSVFVRDTKKRETRGAGNVMTEAEWSGRAKTQIHTGQDNVEMEAEMVVIWT